MIPSIRPTLPLALCLAATASLIAAADPAPAPRPSAADARFTLRRESEAEVVKFPWGWIHWLMNTKADPAAEMTIGIVYIEPNQRNPFHMHPNCAEYVHVLSGSCEQRFGDQWIRMNAGDTLRIPKGVPHVARTGAEPCRSMICYDTGDRQMVVLDPPKPAR
jgi:quercetin dioxygenase-like cupin family protein